MAGEPVKTAEEQPAEGGAIRSCLRERNRNAQTADSVQESAVDLLDGVGETPPLHSDRALSSGAPLCRLFSSRHTSQLPKKATAIPPSTSEG